MTTTIKPDEFTALRDYIEARCGISLTADKAYLVETRLTRLMLEQGCDDFASFIQKLRTDDSPELSSKIIDAMTTNETLWFRDAHPFDVFEKELVPKLMDLLASGRKYKVRIWSAACSTGQEPYSLAMIIHRMHELRRHPMIQPLQFEIVATDISQSALFLAKNARYNQIHMARGMREEYRERYFRQEGPVWVLDEAIRKMVHFQHFNLQSSFAPLGIFDIILVRNVAIYFSAGFKQDLFDRIARSLNRPGYLLIGSTESLRGVSDSFTLVNSDHGVYYEVKQGATP